MNLLLTASKIINNQNIRVSGSKSESNRLLILQQLFSNLTINNLSNSDDTEHLQNALSTQEELVNIGHAGTAMRFLTAFFASKENIKKVVCGSKRMHNRPIKILVDALRELGAEINYLEKEGYPPIQIIGKKLIQNSVAINGNVSSQYISALMLIAPSLPNGLSLTLIGEVTSVPYIEMTLKLLHQLSIEATFINNVISIEPQNKIEEQSIVVESDWSSASYWYSLVALSSIGTEITLSSYKKDSLQGDACLAKIYTHFGVQTTYSKNKITLNKKYTATNKPLNLDLKNAPDIAQTIAVTAFGLQIESNLTGLHTLKIKETDRLEALKKELTKLGAVISVTNKSLHLKKQNTAIAKNIAIETYNDHRMAMAFAPLALLTPIKILDAQVVTKSYRSFWEDFKKVGVLITAEK